MMELSECQKSARHTQMYILNDKATKGISCWMKRHASCGRSPIGKLVCAECGDGMEMAGEASIHRDVNPKYKIYNLTSSLLTTQASKSELKTYFLFHD
jgi:hypothetical protein